MLKKLAACIMVMAIAVAFMPTSAFAASKSAKMTAYNQVIVSGSHAYCAGAGGIYKVKLNNGEKENVQRLYDSEGAFGPYAAVEAMKKQDGYIYFRFASEGTCTDLARVKCTGGNVKYLALTGNSADYAIKGKRIYFYKYTDNDKIVKRVMKFNGKNKKKTSVKPVLKEKKTNKSGYRIIIKKKGHYMRDYLKTPKGTFYLGKAEL